MGGDRDKQIRRLWAKRFPALKSEAEVFQAAETRDRLNKNACDLYIGSALMVKDTWDPDKYVRGVGLHTVSYSDRSTYTPETPISMRRRQHGLRDGARVPAHRVRGAAEPLRGDRHGLARLPSSHAAERGHHSLHLPQGTAFRPLQRLDMSAVMFTIYVT